jgi:hypothetical protein
VATPWVKAVFWSYLLFLVWASATVTNPADPDLWHRLAVGEFLWQHGHFPVGDTFSYLSDYKEIADHEWGCAVIFYALWQWGGGTAMVATKLVTLAVTLVLVVWAGIRDRSPAIWMAAYYALVLLAMLPAFQSTVRCMVFTQVLFALWVYWFQRERRGRPVPTVFYIATMILWANLHGGFAIGLAWLFLVTVVEAIYQGDWKKAAVRLGLCALATLVNPFGWELWISTGRALVANRSGFDEWAPVSWIATPLLYPGYKLLLVGVLLALAVQIYRKAWREMDQVAVILIGAFAVLSVISARHTSLFAVVAGALLPGLVGDDWKYVHGYHPLRKLGIMGLSAGPALIMFFLALRASSLGAGLTLEYPPVAAPVDAVDFLKKQNVRGNLLVSFNYGSYALWQLRGQMRVSMDGRYDLVYKPETYARVEDFFEARGEWNKLLTNPAPDAILVSCAAEVYPKLKSESDWKEAWNNNVDAVFLPR